MQVQSFAAFDAKSPLRAHQFFRHAPEAQDVQIDILFCGVCHSDLHTVNGDWGPAQYPLTPGHEIVGRVEKVGSKTSKFKVGDIVGVGCFVDSCRACSSCLEGEEQYCEKGATFTYGSNDPRGGVTQGGYSTKIVVHEDYVVRIPEGIPLQNAAPLLCAGITTYSPLKHWKIQAGQKVAVAGLGGLGHMAVKLAAAMGADVTVLSTSENKRKDAMKLGAHHFVVTKDTEAMAKVANTFQLIINAISAEHSYEAYLKLLKKDGTMVLLGVPPAQSIGASSLIGKRKSLAGSLIGGIAETQEMLNFCAQHGLSADVEVIAMKDINQAYERMVEGDVHYRFVIDLQSLK